MALPAKVVLVCILIAIEEISLRTKNKLNEREEDTFVRWVLQFMNAECIGFLPDFYDLCEILVPTASCFVR